MCHRSLAAIRGPTRSASIRIPTILVLGLSAPMFALAGCEAGSGADDAAAFTVRDSAGVTIAESTDSAWTDATRWRIAAEPDLVIGSVDGSVPGTDFGSSPDPLPVAGGIAVLNYQTDDIRVFDTAGTWVRTLGGLGDGPAEFRALDEIAEIRGDSIAAADRSARKIVVFPPGDGSARVHSIVSATHGGRYDWAVVGWRPDGSYLLRAADDPREPMPEGRNHRWMRYVLYSPAGDSVTAFDSLPHYPAFENQERSGRTIMGISALARMQGDVVWHGYPNGEFSFVGLDTESGGRTVVRRTFDHVPTPPDVLEQAAARELAAFEDASATLRSAVRAQWDAAEATEFLPSYRDFRVGPDGQIWANLLVHPDELREEDRPWISNYGSPRWSVFDADGRWLGTLELPERLDLQEVGRDWILGVQTDELDVPFIVRYPIIRP